MNLFITDSLPKLDMIVSEQVKADALRECKKFLGGSWMKCSLDKFKITNLIGALTNYIYICELDPSIQVEEHEYTTVLMRLHGEINGPHEKFYELLIFNLLSERKIGPRLIGAFKSGRLEQYIESRQVTIDELRTGKYLPQIAQKMARYHCMDVPLCKYPNFIPRFLKKYTKYFERAVAEKATMNERDRKIVEEVMEMNIVQEYQDLQQKLEEMNSHVVFCHNDIQEGNLLVPARTSNAADQTEIMLIDYEYSYYGRRGYDIGNHFCEWVMQNIADTPEGFAFDPDAYPDKEKQLWFANEYLKCISEELKDAPESKRSKFMIAPEDLLREANSHSLMSHLFWGFWGFGQYFLSQIEWDFLSYAICRFRLFKHFKKQFYPPCVK